MKMISSSELKKHFGRYKRAVKAGQTFVVTLRGKPIAKIIPVNAEDRR